MTLNQLQLRSPRIPKKTRSKRRQLDLCPQKKGTILKTYITTPRKPNSALRKVSRVLLSNYERMSVYIPGMTHNLQKHGHVLVRGGRVKDLPGVRYTSIRGKYDFQHLVERRKGRSKYGTSRLASGAAHAPYGKVNPLYL